MLMFHGRDICADFFALNVLHICQHFILAEIAFREIIHNLGSAVESWQRDEVMEDTSFASDIRLEGLQARIKSGR